MSDLKAMRRRLLVLSASCPSGQDNPPHCPLRSVRRLDHAWRLTWLDSLGPEEIAHLLARHEDCPTRTGIPHPT